MKLQVNNAQEAESLSKYLDKNDDLEVKDVKVKGYSVSFNIDEDNIHKIASVFPNKKAVFSSLPLKKPGAGKELEKIVKSEFRT